MDNKSKKSDNQSGDKKDFQRKLNLAEVKRIIRRDFKDLKEFYLEEENIQKLSEMGRIKQWSLTIIWLFKSLFLKLTSVRRLLLIVGLALIFVSFSTTVGETTPRIDSNVKIIGGIILLFILMLELKDKLLARDELIAGRSVQESLMPESSPKIPGWDVWLYSRPANDVGGDLIDYFQLDKNRYGFALGDVSGKGLPAALLMAKLQSTLRALVTEFDSLAELGSKINKIFHRDSMSKIFASLVYFVLTSNSGKIKLLNAGHPPPMIFNIDGVNAFAKGDVALGIVDKSIYNVNNITINKGDYFIIYSDGVTESQNDQGEFYGKTNLTNLLTTLINLSAQEAGIKILDSVERFIDEAPFFDDLSLMILKWL